MTKIIKFSEVLCSKMAACDPPMTAIRLAAEMEAKGHPVRVETIVRWMAGTHPPKMGSLLVMADILDITLSDMQAQSAPEEEAGQ